MVDGSGGGDFSGVFVAFIVIGAVIGIGSLLWRVSTAQRIAEKSGMDVGDATTMALLSDDGLEATYLASNLRGAAEEAGKPATGDVADRLRRLRDLLDQGLITQEEHDARRKAIIDSV